MTARRDRRPLGRTPDGSPRSHARRAAAVPAARAGGPAGPRAGRRRHDHRRYHAVDGRCGPGEDLAARAAGLGQRPRRARGGGNQMTQPARRYRLDAGDDPEAAERSLAALVLTIVELLRQLMERQAIRRVEDGTVTDDQAEQLGDNLMQLDERMTELVEKFGLTREDLNIYLGPLGPLLGE